MMYNLWIQKDYIEEVIRNDFWVNRYYFTVKTSLHKFNLFKSFLVT